MDMPGYRRGFSRNRKALSLRPVNSIKNYFTVSGGLSGTQNRVILAKAVTSPAPAVSNDVSHGCNIKAIYFTVDVCGLAGTGTLNIADFFMWKNPGANLTPPDPVGYGGSNEKKFIFKTWRAMIMRNQDGNVPYHWEGWLRIPKRYQRMGTDDLIEVVMQCTPSVTGHFSLSALYKWFR